MEQAEVMVVLEKVIVIFISMTVSTMPFDNMHGQMGFQCGGQ